MPHVWRVQECWRVSFFSKWGFTLNLTIYDSINFMITLSLMHTGKDTCQISQMLISTHILCPIWIILSAFQISKEVYFMLAVRKLGSFRAMPPRFDPKMLLLSSCSRRNDPHNGDKNQSVVPRSLIHSLAQLGSKVRMMIMQHSFVSACLMSVRPSR